MANWDRAGPNPAQRSASTQFATKGRRRRKRCRHRDLDQRLTGERVATVLDRVARDRGLPEKIRVDNGSEFTGKVLDQWAYVNMVRLDFSRRGKPTDDGLIEAFNGRLRTECLNENWFMSIDDAREKLEAWRRHYNEELPHSALGHLSPREFAASKAQECAAG